MRHTLFIAPLAAAALILTGCTAGVGGGGNTDGGEDDKTPVTLTLWSFFGDREKAVIDTQLDAFSQKYPWITVKHVGGQSDDTMLQAVRGGTGPDIDLSGASEAVPSYCSTGVFQDLGPFIEKSQAAVDTILPSTLAYTSSGDTRCAMPMLADVYGLYYNKDLFAEAGISAPPKTWDELAEVAKKLTVRDADGTIERAGFVPFLDFSQSNASTWTPGWGLDWYDESGAAAMATDPQWAAMFKWQKDLVDWYGYDNLQRFVAGLGNEFSAENPFQTGKIAMNVDGEWRVAFIQDQAPGMNYGTAPIPNVDPSNYGAGAISGTTVGIPKGSKHPEAAWLLAKYLATDTDSLVQTTLGLRNVPTTSAALASPEVRTDEQFNTMLDIAANPATSAIPGSPAGSAPRELVGQFAQGWQSGATTDLTSGLQDVAKQIDSQIEQAAGGIAP